MTVKKNIFSAILIINLLSGCGVPLNEIKPIENTVIKATQPKDINNQGPSSTGGLFRINYKDGTAASLSNFKVLAQSNDTTSTAPTSEIGSGKTDETGAALLPASIITPELIKQLKDNKIKLLIKVSFNEKDFTAEIKNIDYKSDNLISITAEVDAPTPVELRLSQKTVNISKMQTVNIYPEVLMSDGSKNSNVNWASSDETVATVKNGKISGLKKGVTIITVSAIAGMNIQNKIIVTVDDDVQVNSVNIINPSDKAIINKITLKINENRQLEAHAILSDGSVSGNIIWKSSDESKVSVGRNSGLITGISTGSATVTAVSTEDIHKTATIEIVIAE
jgi:uncharacterized protein YjdB